MNHLEQTMQALLERNKRVEAEKAWEVSLTRRLFVAALTYITAVIIFWFLREPQFALIALVPTCAYFLSTLSLPWLKRWWMRTRLSGRQDL